MNNIKSIEGKIVKSISTKTIGTSSTLMIIFTDGSKINIVASINGEEGVAQLDVDLNGKNPKDAVGQKVINVIEKFDGEKDYIIMKLKSGIMLTVSAFCTSEKSTTNLNTFVYASDKIVKESIIENEYPKRGRYPLSAPQYKNTEKNEPETWIKNDKSIAKEIFNDLEIWLKKHNIYDENEELEEIESWLDINLEPYDENIQDLVLNLVRNKYDI